MQTHELSIPRLAAQLLLRIIKGVGSAHPLRSGFIICDCKVSSYRRKSLLRLLWMCGINCYIIILMENIEVNDLVTLRKVHPCGGREWKVVRIGADIGLE